MSLDVANYSPDELFLFGFFLFFELAEGDFADFGYGEFVTEFVSGWEGVDRDVSLKQFPDFAFDALTRLVTWLQNDKGLRHLTLIVMVYANDGRGEDSFVRVDDGLKVGWINVIARGDDNALESLCEVDEAIFAKVTDVTSMEPEFAVIVKTDCLGGFSIITKVAHHN